MSRGGIDAYLIGLRYGHHASRSGYESFQRHLRTEVLRSPLPFRGLKRAWRLDRALQERLDRPCYTLALLAQELSTIPHAARHRGVPHHVIYADTDLRFLGPAGAAVGAPVVATFHEPSWGLEYMRIDAAVTRGLAAVILQSETQRSWFEELVPADRTFVVPHGVDSAYFVPGGRPTRPRLLVVGSKYRDFGLLSSTVDILEGRRTEVELVAVGTHHNLERPFDDPRFEYVSPPDDAALRTTYRSARVAVFPMLHATANNALLEAMACGVPVVATDVGGIGEYVGGAGILCAPGDPEAMAEAIAAVLGDDDLAASLGTAARRRAEELDFTEAAAAHRAVYQAVSS